MIEALNTYCADAIQLKANGKHCTSFDFHSVLPQKSAASVTLAEFHITCSLIYTARFSKVLEYDKEKQAR